MSDLHIGSPETDYKKIAEDLARPGRILIAGDIFDAIISSDEKRYRPGAIHPRLCGRDDILNAAVDWGTELLAPHAKRIDLLGVGNHETSIEKHGSTDMGLWLADKLGFACYGGYTGFVEYRFSDEQRHSHGYTIFYHHGAGSGGSASSAINEFPRKMAFVDADLIWMGHKHHRMTTHMRRISCPKGGSSVRYSEVRFIMSGAYMDTYAGQSTGPRHGNYAEDRGLPPQGKGGAQLILTAGHSGITTEVVL